MSHSTPLILQVHLAGAEPYELGDEIWQQSLPDAIRAEAETIADYAGPELLGTSSQAARIALRDRIIAEMTAALRWIGDAYTAPDGIAYTLSPIKRSLTSRRAKLRSPPWPLPSRLRSSSRFFASRISRSAHQPHVPQSCAGATAPKAKPSPRGGRFGLPWEAARPHVEAAADRKRGRRQIVRLPPYSPRASPGPGRRTRLIRRLKLVR